MPALVGLDDDLVCDALTFVCRDVRWMSYMIAFSGERNLPGLYSAAVFLLLSSTSRLYAPSFTRFTFDHSAKLERFEHNYTAKQKLLHKPRAGKSYIPDKTCSKSTS
jgi:hypothetical protein